MKVSILLFLFFAAVLFFRNTIEGQGKRQELDEDEVRRRSRRFLFGAIAFSAGLTLLFLGLRVGLLGGVAALAGILILSGATITGLMKLRGWFS